MQGTHISDVSCGKATLRRGTVKHFLANFEGFLATGCLAFLWGRPCQIHWIATIFRVIKLWFQSHAF